MTTWLIWWTAFCAPGDKRCTRIANEKWLRSATPMAAPINVIQAKAVSPTSSTQKKFTGSTSIQSVSGSST